MYFYEYLVCIRIQRRPRLTVNLGFHYLPKYAFRSHLHTNTPDRRQSKTLILSTNVDKKYLETVFDCHLSPDVSSDFVNVRRLLRAFSVTAYPV